MNTNNKIYVISPYLRYIKDNDDYVIYNFLNNNIHVINKNEKSIMDYCKSPRTIAELNSRFDVITIKRLISSRFLLQKDNIWNQEHVTNLEIETSTICNWKCNYCPASFYKRNPQKIEMDLYKYILDKAYEFKKIKTVSIQSYNEPSIDDCFFDYVKEIKQRGFKLVLYTNGSNLSNNKIKLLNELQVVERIVFNLPAVDKNLFIKMTNNGNVQRTLNAIRSSIDYGFEVIVSVQGKSCYKDSQVEKIKLLFPEAKIEPFVSLDRAGTLKNEYFQNISIRKDYLTGCITFNNTAHIAINGDMYICCNDYFKKYVYANIKDNNFKDIFSSNNYIELRKKIFGSLAVDNQFICKHCSIMEHSLSFRKVE